MRIEPFCTLYVTFCSLSETICRALKQMHASSCRFREQPRERLFTSASVHLSSLPLGIHWFCCSICRRQYYNHHHHFALGIRLQMRYLVLRVCNIVNIVAFSFKIRKLHTSLSVASKVIAVCCNGAICSTEGFTRLLGVTLLLGLPVLPLLIKKRGLIWTGRPIFTKLHVHTVRSEHTLARAM